MMRLHRTQKAPLPMKGGPSVADQVRRSASRSHQHAIPRASQTTGFGGGVGKVSAVQPIVLGPNMPEMFYRGDGRIDRLRGTSGHEDRPEDWIASVTARFGTDTDGMTRLPDGSLLAEAVAADPEAWLGAEHVARYGSDTGLLVKLLDAGQRLPVHVHPARRFAAEHLGRPHGKTESWIVLEAEPDAAVYLGFSRDVGADELTGWTRSQDVEAMLAATNRVPVAAGDRVLCPAGTVHAIGAGILVSHAPAGLSSGPQRRIGRIEEASVLQPAVQRGGRRVVAPGVVPAALPGAPEPLLLHGGQPGG